MKFINKNSLAISLIFITLISLSAALKRNKSKESPRSCSGANNTLPECRWVNIVGNGGFCISDKNNNGEIKQANCADTPDMLWNVVPMNGGLLIQSKNGRALDNAGQRSDNGNKSLGYKVNNSPAQVWLLENVDGGKHLRIKNKKANKCLDNSGTAKVGQYYHIWDCGNDNKNQWFTFEVPHGASGYVNIVGPTGLCVSDRDNNGKLVQEKCSNSNNMQWTFLPSEGGNRIVISKNGRVFDNSGSSSANKNPTLGYTRHNGANQQWAVEGVDNNAKVRFRNPQRNKCFDDTGKKNVGNIYWIWDCESNNHNQHFELKAYVAPAAPSTKPTPLVAASNIDDNLERNLNSKRKMRKGRKARKN